MCIGTTQTPAVGSVATQSIGSTQGATSPGNGSGGGAMSGAGGSTLSRPGRTLLTGAFGTPSSGPSERVPTPRSPSRAVMNGKLGGGDL